MITIPYKMVSMLVVVQLTVALIAGCTTAGERESAPSVAKEEPAKSKEKKEPAAARKTAAKTAAKPGAGGGAAAGKKPAVSPAKAVPNRSSIYLGSDGKPAGTGDPSKPVSEAYKIGMSARPAALAGAGLPKDKFGLIDWVAVVKKGEIKPIGSLDPSKPDIPPFDMDVLIVTKGDFVNNVVFPHSAHTYWLGCENCHPAIFVMGKGKNKMSMVEISEGKWCGRCHGKVAFPLTDCSRCHTKKKS